MAFILMVGLSVVSATSVFAGTLTAASWAVSNNQAGATAVNYSYSFTTATADSIATITFVLSSGTLAGTPTIVVAYGVGAGSVALTLGTTLTYTVTAPVAIGAGIPIFIEFGGLTNPSSGTFTTAITTANATPATIDSISPGPSITFSSTNTAESIVVAQSLTFTEDTTSFTLEMDPSLPALADQTRNINLSVKTNANSGYTLTVSDLATHLQGAAAGHPTIAQVSAGKAGAKAWPGAPATGYTVYSFATGLTIDPAFGAGGAYAGYTSAGEQVASRSGPTGNTADTIVIEERTAIDYSVPATTFTDTITYTVAPNYT